MSRSSVTLILGLATALLCHTSLAAGDAGPDCSNLPQTADAVTLNGTEGKKVVLDAPWYRVPGCEEPGDTLSFTISWGDGSTSSGTVVPDAGDQRRLTVHGEHVYTRPISGAQIVITERNESNGVSRGDTHYKADIAAAAPSIAMAVPRTAPRRFHGIVAYILTPGRRTAREMSASVSWGDGTKTAGKLRVTKKGLAIVGSHRWSAKSRTARLRVRVVDKLGGGAVKRTKRVHVSG